MTRNATTITTAIRQAANKPSDDVSRRDIATALIGAIGLAALTGSSRENEAQGGGPDPEPDFDTTSAALQGGQFQWVDSMADLRAYVGGPTAPVVVLGYYNTQGDGGGGLFYWDANASEADNKGTIIKPTAVIGNGRWKRLFSGHFNVKWFGARGNDSTDDRQAIQDLIDHVSALGGGTIFFPKGTYRISQALTVTGWGVRLVGEDRSNAVIKTTSSTDCTAIQFAAGAALSEVSQLRFLPSTIGGPHLVR